MVFLMRDCSLVKNPSMRCSLAELRNEPSKIDELTVEERWPIESVPPRVLGQIPISRGRVSSQTGSQAR